ncbi:MAG: hypothetical protein IIZ94_09455, partial [Prevotella sp.]|nr:hypothetical protein [Prevotella sp.]
MKRLVLTLAICLGCIGILGAQNVWKPIDVSAAFLGAAPDGSLYFNCGYSGIGRSQDEGETLQIVLGYETGNDYYFNEYCFSVSPEGRIFVFEDNTFRAWYSDDYGDTWQQTSGIPLSAGDKAWNLYAFNNQILVGSTEYGSVFWTTDCGTTWGMDDTSFEDNSISDILVTESGDVYVGLYYYGNGLYHSTLSDMQNWELVAFEGFGIRDMEFDPDGNVVCAGYGNEFSGFEYIPGFYALAANYISISDNGIVYTINYHDDDFTEGLSYSLDHGEHFTEIGERMFGSRPLPNCCVPMKWLIKGFDNHLYYIGVDHNYMSYANADEIVAPTPYYPIVEDGKQWNVLFSYPWNPPEPQHKYTDIYKIEGDTLVDGVSYKVMYTTRNEDLTGWSVCGVIRETEDRQVLYRRDGSSYDEILYDFSMEVGDTIIMNGSGFYPDWMFVVETNEILINGEPRKQIVLEYSWGDQEVWIEGIGSLYGIIDSGS